MMDLKDTPVVKVLRVRLEILVTLDFRVLLAIREILLQTLDPRVQGDTKAPPT
jgi:hypothetical protein